jgi:hypothetical protein
MYNIHTHARTHVYLLDAQNSVNKSIHSKINKKENNIQSM